MSSEHPTKHVASPDADDRVARRKLKKKRKLLVKDGRGTRQDFYDFYGPDARAGLELKIPAYFKNGRLALKPWDIQNLILWVLAEAVSPQWVFVKNKPLVEKVVFIVADGLHAVDQTDLPSLSLFNAHKGPLPLQVSSSVFADNVFDTFLNISKKRITGKRKRNKVATQSKSARKPPASFYLLNNDELRTNNYPLSEQGYVRAPDRLCAKALNSNTADPNTQAQTQVNTGCGTVDASPNGVATTDGLAKCSENGTDLSAEPAAKRTKGGSAAATPTDTIAPAGGRCNSNGDEGGCGDGSNSGHESSSSSSSISGSGSGSSSSSSNGSDTLSDEPTGANPFAALGGLSDEEDKDIETSDTAAKADEDNGERVVGLDCEMVTTKEGLELARTTLVDSNHQVLLDMFSVPHNPILDYNTRYSGITADTLKGVTNRLKDVQAAFFALVSKKTIVCGHSLENDFRALNIIHTRAIDTALLYPHPRGPPMKSALRFLSHKWLKKKIQTQGASGHDSVEDAVTALQLAQLKFKHGPSFGIAKRDTESLTAILARHRRQAYVVASAPLLQKHSPVSLHAIPVSTDGEAVRKSLTPLRANNDLLIISLADLLQAQRQERQLGDKESQDEAEEKEKEQEKQKDEAKEKKQEEGGKKKNSKQRNRDRKNKEKRQRAAEAAEAAVQETKEEPVKLRPQSLVKAEHALDLHLKSIYQESPANTLLILVSGQTDRLPLKRLQKRKVVVMCTKVGVWTEVDEARLQMLQKQTQFGVCYFAMK